MTERSCPECGARLPLGAERCDLCGSPLDASVGDSDTPTEPGSAGGADVTNERDAAGGAGIPADPDLGNDIPEPSTPLGADPASVSCTTCDAVNPPEANFCSRCGARLSRPVEGGGGLPIDAQPSSPSLPAAPPGRPAAAVSPAGAPVVSSGDDDAHTSQRDLTRHVGILIGLAVLVVVALYLITIISKQPGPATSEAAVAAPAESRAASVIQRHEALPIGEAFRGRFDSLQAVIDEADVAGSVETRRRLVDFLIGIGRVDRAAIEQQRVARITGEAPDWKKAGNLLFDWMEMTEPDSKRMIALLVIDAYKEVLQLEPGDLDARADLGWAYQYDPQNPMEAIRQTNLVLEESPEHITANYNKGVFLMRINRLDDAADQFERVKKIAGSESPYHRQAQMWIDTIRDAKSQGEAS